MVATTFCWMGGSSEGDRGLGSVTGSGGCRYGVCQRAIMPIAAKIGVPQRAIPGEFPGEGEGVVKSSCISGELFTENGERLPTGAIPHPFSTPTERFQTPTERFQTPTERFQTSTERFQTSTERFQISTERFQTPTERFQTPTERFQTPTPLRGPTPVPYESSVMRLLQGGSRRRSLNYRFRFPPSQ